MNRIVPLVAVMAVCTPLLADKSAFAADPTTADCLAANETAISLRKDHHMREARSAFLLCAAASCPADVREQCVRRIEEINAAIPTVVFEAKDGTGNDLRDVKVTMDGQLLAERLEGIAISIDPGEHLFEFETSGAPSVSKRFIIRQGEKSRRERITLATLQPAGAGVYPAGAVAPSGSPSTMADSQPASNTGRRNLGLILGGVGITGIVIAVFEQATALNRQNSSAAAANSSIPEVQATSGPLRQQAEQAQTYAIVSGSIGAAAIAAGVYFVLTSSSSSSRPRARASAWEATVQVGSTNGITLGRAW